MSDTKKNKNLFFLDELSGYKVASHYPNVKDWEVQDADGTKIGKVDRLMVNKKTERVVYLDVEVDKSIIEEGHEPFSVGTADGVHEFLNKEGDNHLIIPIGLVHLDEENKRVRTNEISRSTFAKTPRYNRENDFVAQYELTIMRSYTGEDAFDLSSLDDESFYNRREFDDNRDFKRGL
ncbi:MAG TPA: PRC-barrel domain-containing protein [Flavobacterium sp.]|jgi:sporulation protein YlmC with PRC-barrel domain